MTFGDYNLALNLLEDDQKSADRWEYRSNATGILVAIRLKITSGPATRSYLCNKKNLKGIGQVSREGGGLTHPNETYPPTCQYP